MKVLLFGIIALIIAFIASVIFAPIFNEDHSTASVIIGGLFCLGYTWLVRKGYIDRI